MNGSPLELALFVAASLGVVLSMRAVLRIIRSRAAIERKLQRN